MSTIRTVEQLATEAARKSFDLDALENSVFDLVCGLTEEERSEYLDESDDWMETGSANSNKYPQFADPYGLGDWDGYDLESVQSLCQQVYNVAATEFAE